MVNKKIIVSKDDIRYNISVLKKEMKTKIIAVLKGDGYGLGLVNMANLLRDCKIDFFAVSEVNEALKLRKEGFLSETILLLTPSSKEEEVRELIKNNITLTLDSYENGELYSSVCEDLKKTVDVHIKIDTGFGRFGFSYHNKEEIVKALRLKNLNYMGIYSHFSSAFEKKYKITKKQFENFLSLISYLETFDFKFQIKHIANSSAALKFENTRLDAVRLGSAILGRIPVANTLNLRKIAYLESEVLSVKTLKADSNIGYGNTYKTKGITDIAIIPVGYKDGFMTEKSQDTFRIRDVLRAVYNNVKSFGKKNYVNINGTNYKIVGRVGMYNTVADVTGGNVKPLDKVTLNINPLLANSNITREYR